LALAPFAHWGFDAMQIDCGTVEGDDYDMIATAEECSSLLLVLMLVSNLVRLAPIGSFDGAAIVGALVRGRATRALFVAVVLAALGFAMASGGSARYAGAVAGTLIVMWVYATLAGDACDRRSEPMSRSQFAITLAALVLTIAVYIGVSRALLPEFVNAMSQRCDDAPAETDVGSPALYPVRDNHTAAP
jgi:hypothetical protein